MHLLYEMLQTAFIIDWWHTTNISYISMFILFLAFFMLYNN